MSTTPTNETTKRGPSTYETVLFPVEQIDPSPFQPRKEFNDLEGLAASIREHGIIQPLIVRRTTAAPERVELVAGERRLRAAKLAEFSPVPVIIRELSDTAAEEILLIENLQRVDLRASEEARGLQRMLELRAGDGAALYSIRSLAEKLGKDERHVADRLKLLLCPKELIEQVDGGAIALSTAMLVGRIPDAKARAACAKLVMAPEIQQIPLNYAQTKELIREKFMVKIDAKRFDPEDANLVPAKIENDVRCHGGACVDCPFRSGNIDGGDESKQAGEGERGRPRGADANLCTMPACFKLKLDAQWREEKHKAEKDGKRTLDGKAAEKVFGGYNGRIAHDAGFKMLDENEHLAGLGFVKIRAAIKGEDVPITLARHPETHEIIELVAEKDLEAALAAKAKAEKDKPLDPKAQAAAELEQERKADEKRQAKLDQIALHEGVNELVAAIHRRGVDADFHHYIFQMALDAGGADGMFFMGKWLKIELAKGEAHSGRAYEAAIIAKVKELAETPTAWLAYTVVALLARGLKWQGLADDDFEQVLQRFGIKKRELVRRAEALLAGGEKTKKPKEEKKPAANSSDPTSFSVESEASKTAAADERAKSDSKPAPPPSEVDGVRMKILRRAGKAK